MQRTPPLSTTAARITPPVFAVLQARIDRLGARAHDLVPLQIGDTWISPPEAARAVLADVDASDLSLYRYGATAGEPALREALAAWVAKHGLVIDPKDEVLIGNGGTHALFCAARAVLDAGDEVLLAGPHWPLAPGIFTACGAHPIDVPITQRLFDDPAYDAGAAFAARVTPRTKALYVISPNNPDGKVLSRRDLESIAAVAREHDLWVFSDEVYADVVFHGEHLSIATLDGMRERTIVLHSMAKSHAMAGCRIGAVFAPASVIASARRVSVISCFNVPVLMQRAALAALGDDAFEGRARAAYREGRDRALAALSGSGINVHASDGGNFLFLDFRSTLEGRPLLALLERAVDHGVLLAPGDAFGTSYQSCARLCTTAVPPDRVVAGIERLLDAAVALRSDAP